MSKQQSEINDVLGGSIEVAVDVTQDCILMGQLVNEEGRLCFVDSVEWALILAGVRIRGVFMNEDDVCAGVNAAAPWGEIRGLIQLPDAVFKFLVDFRDGKPVQSFSFTIRLCRAYVDDRCAKRAKLHMDRIKRNSESTK